MTYIIGIISQKGGVGKSTLSRAIGREAANSGMKVKIADLDIQQATSANWYRRRLEKNITPTFSVESFKTADQAIESKNNFDLLIIDGPARASKGTLEIAKASDLLIQPTGASLDDLEPAVLTFHELVKNRIEKKKLVFALCRVGTDPEEQECRYYLDQAGYMVLNGCLFEKPAYRQAQNMGFSVTETRYSSLNNKSDELIQSVVERL
jgi:chromosome partitioning protein